MNIIYYYYYYSNILHKAHFLVVSIALQSHNRNLALFFKEDGVVNIGSVHSCNSSVPEGLKRRLSSGKR